MTEIDHNQTFDPQQFSGSGDPVKVADNSLPEFTFTPENFDAHQRSLEEERQRELNRLRELPLGPIPRWSFSALSNFEKCPYMLQLSKVDGYPDPAGKAAERGLKVHDNIENFIMGETDDLCKEAAKNFENLINNLRNHYEDGTVEVEGEWAHDRDWDTTNWGDENAWARIKLDAIWFESDTSARVYDWKTGRKFGNELKHAQQLQLYVIGAFLRFPDLQFVEGQMVYLDKNDRLIAHYTREEAMAFMDKWTRRGLVMTTTTEFEPQPSEYNCKWCPHAKIQEGYTEPACPYAFKE